MKVSKYNHGYMVLRAVASLLLTLQLVSCGGSGLSDVGSMLADTIVQTVEQSQPLRSTAQIDTDRDGIPDSIELELGTNPYSNDTDLDGLSDHYELWGLDGYAVGEIGSMMGLPDPNGNGIISALDPGDMGNAVLKNHSAILGVERIPVTAPDGSFLPNDVDGDGIPNDYELHGFYFKVAEDGLPYFYKWDGLDIEVKYFKTDPTQWSSDGDPFSDWEEATKINLDQRVKSPGDHPCIPAYPRLEAVLTSYTIELIEDTVVQTAEGGRAEQSWTNALESVNNGNITTETRGREGELKIGGTFKRETDTGIYRTDPFGFGGSIDIELNGYELLGGGSTTINSSVTINDTSGLSAEEWSTATSTATNTASAARLILNMKVINTGTLPATNAKVLFNLMIGSLTINSFVLNLEEFGELQPMMANPIDLRVAFDGRPAEFAPEGDPLELSIYQLRSIQMGAPLAIAPQGFVAETLVWELDPATGRRKFLAMGPWGPYESAIQNVSAHLILDFRRDPQFAVGTINGLPPRTTSDTRVFCYRTDSSYFGSPPDIRLGDAFIWAFNAVDSDLGPIVTIKDPISGSKHTSPLALWDFGLDKLTIEKILANPESFGNVFNLPLEPGNPGERVYTCSAPPPEALRNPKIYWATCEPKSRKIRAFSRDVRGLKEMRFKPDPDADYDGELMELGYDVADGHQQFFYTYTVPTQYKWTGREQVVAINNAEKRTVLEVQIEGSQLGFLVAEGTYGIVWDETGTFSQGFSFDSDVITDSPYDITFSQSFDPADTLSITITPQGNGGVHDALYVLDPVDSSGNPLYDDDNNQIYTLDYNYLRKQAYGTFPTDEPINKGIASVPPLNRTYAVRTQEGRLVVFRLELEAVQVGPDYKYKVRAIKWRAYEGI